MDKLRFAMIGCGRIAHKSHSEAIIENRSLLECVVACDLVEEKARSFSNVLERAGLKKPEISLKHTEVLQRYDIDVVVIATESGKHYEITRAALEAGKHVLVEKPMALSVKHMNELIELAREKNLKLGVCFQNRFNPPVQELRKKIEAGAFGKINYGVIQVRWNRNKEYYRMASWRGTWAMDGGVLMNQSTHGIDLLQWMLGGEIEEVYGRINNFSHPQIEAEDFGSAVVKFKNGSIGIIEATSTVYPQNLEERLSIFGERGTVVIGGLAVNRVEVWRFPGEDSHPFMNLPDPETVYGKGHIPLYKDFCEAILENRPPYISGEEGRKAVELVLAIYKSALENRPVRFPLTDFSTLEMEGFFSE